MIPHGSRRPSTLIGLAALVAAANAGAQPDPHVLIRVVEQARLVLWVGAHPDDENAAGGLLARAADVSGGLVMATLTRGENSHRTWAGLCRGSAIGRARAALFARAAATFGARAHVIGPFVNGPHSLAWLDRHCPPGAPFSGWPPGTDSAAVIAKWRREGEPLRWMTGLLRRWQPDVVVAMDGYCGVTGNPEHIAVARLLREAMTAAADPDRWPALGSPWVVGHVVWVARVSPAMAACGHCRCEGAPPPGPVHRVPTLERSARRGVSYFRVACRVARHYETAMTGHPWPAADIERRCRAAEARLAAPPFPSHGTGAFEPYRLQTRTRPTSGAARVGARRRRCQSYLHWCDAQEHSVLF